MFEEQAGTLDVSALAPSTALGFVSGHRGAALERRRDAGQSQAAADEKALARIPTIV
jgi:hypothetical protein